MRNFKSTFSIFAIAVFTAVVLFSSCKPKKIISQAPAAPVASSVQDAPKAAVVESYTDGDGIPDSKDNCPNKAGSSVN